MVSKRSLCVRCGELTLDCLRRLVRSVRLIFLVDAECASEVRCLTSSVLSVSVVAIGAFVCIRVWTAVCLGSLCSVDADCAIGEACCCGFAMFACHERERLGESAYADAKKAVWTLDGGGYCVSGCGRGLVCGVGSLRSYAVADDPLCAVHVESSVDECKEMVRVPAVRVTVPPGGSGAWAECATIDNGLVHRLVVPVGESVLWGTGYKPMRFPSFR